MDASHFRAGVRSRTRLLDGPRFRIAMWSALVGISGQLDDPRARLRGGLPSDLLDAIDTAERPARAGPHEVYLRVAAIASVHVGVAVEVVQGVLAELGARLGPDGRRELRAALPAAWAELVVEPSTLGGGHDPVPTLAPSASARETAAPDDALED